MAEYDLLIKNGTIIDGLQVPRYRGDIAIRDGRIVAMGNIQDTATRVLDATGMIVAPGFMDIHTHYDAALSGGTAWDPYATLSGLARCNHGRDRKLRLWFCAGASGRP